jgi:hypothetical protein
MSRYDFLVESYSTERLKTLRPCAKSRHSNWVRRPG